jgi:hypothetical protein
MSCNRFNVNKLSGSVSGWIRRVQDTGTAKTLTTYLGLLYMLGFVPQPNLRIKIFFDLGEDIRAASFYH